AGDRHRSGPRQRRQHPLAGRHPALQQRALRRRVRVMTEQNVEISDRPFLNAMRNASTKPAGWAEPTHIVPSPLAGEGQGEGWQRNTGREARHAKPEWKNLRGDAVPVIPPSLSL